LKRAAPAASQAGSRSPTLFFLSGIVMLGLIALAPLVAAQPGDPLKAGNNGARSDIRYWNSVIDRLSRPAADGPLTDALRQGPLDQQSDPLDPANLRKKPKAQNQLEDSQVPQDGEGDPLRPE
jgi:hypothetical protein